MISRILLTLSCATAAPLVFAEPRLQVVHHAIVNDTIVDAQTPCGLVKDPSDDSLVLAMEGGISISEDPNIRFTYVSNGAKRFRAEAKDTEGHVFRKEWNVDDSGI